MRLISSISDGSTLYKHKTQFQQRSRHCANWSRPHHGLSRAFTVACHSAKQFLSFLLLRPAASHRPRGPGRRSGSLGHSFQNYTCHFATLFARQLNLSMARVWLPPPRDSNSTTVFFRNAEWHAELTFRSHRQPSPATSGTLGLAGTKIVYVGLWQPLSLSDSDHDATDWRPWRGPGLGKCAPGYSLVPS
jgi:hypothetical protein